MIKLIKAIDSLTLNHNQTVVSPRLAIYEYNPDIKKIIKRPVIFAAKKTSDFIFEITLKVANLEKEVEYDVHGKLFDDRAIFSGSIITKKGGNETITVRVKLNFTPQKFVCVNRQYIEWILVKKGDADSLFKEEIEMEIYFLPHPLPTFIHKGVPIEILRLAVKEFYKNRKQQTAADGLKAQAYDNQWTKKECVTTAFWYNPPKYDTFRGSPHFTNVYYVGSDINVTLYINRWYEAHKSSCSIENCYDLASIVQYFLFLMGGYQQNEVKWAFMNPFGYLKETNLVGIGQCNNPFYSSAGNTKIVADDDSKRTAFGNHAFVQLVKENKILDGCSGPHYGTESPATYVANATDANTPNPPSVRRGTVNDITYNTGIKSVNKLSSTTERSIMSENKNINDFKKAIGYDTSAENMRSTTAHLHIWESPVRSPELGKDWKVSYEEVIPGQPETIKYWKLQKFDESLMISIYIASDNGNTAHNRFLNLGSTHTLIESIFEAGPKNLGEYSAQTYDGSRILWVYRNFVFDVESLNSDVNILEISKWLQESVEDSSQRSEGFPQIENIKVSVSTLAKDKEYKIQFDCINGDLVDFSPVNGLRLIAENINSLTFIADQEIDENLEIILVNSETGASTSEFISLD
jgi:hypothetical protein